MAELVTQAEFAKRMGVGKPAVSNWKKAGLLVFAEDAQGRALVHVQRSEARLNARRDPTRGRPVSAPELPIDAAADEDEAPAPINGRNLASVRREVAEEDLVAKRMRNATDARELVPSIEAERRAGKLGRMARERVQAELRGLAERLAAEREPRTVIALMEAACDRAFTALADAIEGGALERDDDEEVEQAEAA